MNMAALEAQVLELAGENLRRTSFDSAAIRDAANQACKDAAELLSITLKHTTIDDWPDARVELPARTLAVKTVLIEEIEVPT